MAYGLEILTTEGVSSAEHIISAQLVHSQRISGKTGSITVPNYNDSIGYIYMAKKQSGDFKVLPQFSFNNSSKVFSWSPGSAALDPHTSTDNLVFFMRVY